jgi:hypothetical protein
MQYESFEIFRARRLPKTLSEHLLIGG